MPTPHYVNERLQFFQKSKLGSQIRRKSDGEIFIVIRRQNPRIGIIANLRLGKLRLTWRELLDNFEPDK